MSDDPDFVRHMSGLARAVMTMPARRAQSRTGYWLGRLIKDGPLIPIAIIRRAVDHEPGEIENDMRETRSPALIGFVGGVECHPEDAWRHLPLRFDGQQWVRGFGKITSEDYAYRLARLRWAEQHAPETPEAQSRNRVDFNRAKIPF